MADHDLPCASRYTIFIQSATVDDVRRWLEPILGGFISESEAIINDRPFRRYQLAGDSAVLIGASELETEMLVVKIESRDQPWEDDIECADSAYAALKLTVICDGGLPPPYFAWYVHDAYGQGLVEPEGQSNRH